MGDLRKASKSKSDWESAVIGVAVALAFAILMVIPWSADSTELRLLSLESKGVFIRNTLTPLVLFLGVVLTWKRIKIAEEQAGAANENNRIANDDATLSQERLMSERLIDATKLLEKGQNGGRPLTLAGILALDMIALDSPEHSSISVRLLCNMLRSRIVISRRTAATEFKSPASEGKPGAVPSTEPENIPDPEIQSAVDSICRHYYSAYETNSHLASRGLDLRKSNLRGISIHGEELPKLRLEKSKLHYAKFSKVTCVKASFVGSHLEGASFREDSKLTSAEFNGSWLGESVFNRCDISRGIFDSAKMRKIEITSCEARFANLNRTQMKEGRISASNFSHATFKNANMQESNLTGCDFTQCFFTEANLSSVSFEGSILYYANFSGANLHCALFENADIRGADFSGAKNLKPSQIKNAIKDKKTRFPPDWPKEAKQPRSAEVSGGDTDVASPKPDFFTEFLGESLADTLGI